MTGHSSSMKKKMTWELDDEEGSASDEEDVNDSDGSGLDPSDLDVLVDGSNQKWRRSGGGDKSGDEEGTAATDPTDGALR